MSISIIVALTSKNVIGKDNKLPWHISEDLNLFKTLTIGNTVVMGRKTFESIPKKFRPLPNRNNIVITSQELSFKDVDFCPDLNTALQKAKSYGKEIFIIGGKTVYQQILPLTNKLYVSHIKTEYEGDSYFPKINWEDWKKVEEMDYEDFVFRIYERK